MHLCSQKCLTRIFYKTPELMKGKENYSSIFALLVQSDLSRQDLGKRKDTPWIKWHKFQTLPPGSCASSSKLAIASCKHMQKTRPNMIDKLGQVLPCDPLWQPSWSSQCQFYFQMKTFSLKCVNIKDIHKINPPHTFGVKSNACFKITNIPYLSYWNEWRFRIRWILWKQSRPYILIHIAECSEA